MARPPALPSLGLGAYLSAVATAPDNVPEYSVSELSGALRRSIETAFGQVRVRGELSGFKRHASGHIYGCLKDESALIDLVMFKGAAATLNFRPEDGLEVVATGKLTTYPGRSKYQIVVERMAPAGVGALLQQIEQRRLRLAAEGLFDAARKQPLPFLPAVIGVVTSPTGAVIRDILHRLADRFPRHVLVWPVAVQGEAAATQVTAAINGFNALAPGGPVPRPDLIIVARGGGSIEDLAAFNEESVVRAAAASAIPLISAVGHETDTTLLDYAADWRAPTPTAAAERAVPVRADLVAQVTMLGARADRAAARLAALRRERLDAARLPPARTLLALPVQRADDLAERLPRALTAVATRARGRLDRAALHRAVIERRLARAGEALNRLATRLDVAATAASTRAAGRFAGPAAALRPWLAETQLARASARVEQAGRLLDSLGPRQVLARGYALVTGADNQIITSSGVAARQSRLTISFADGDTMVQPAKNGGGTGSQGSRPDEARTQGSLF